MINNITDEERHEIQHDLTGRVIGRGHGLFRLDKSRKSGQNGQDIIRIGITDAAHPQEIGRPLIVEITDSVEDTDHDGHLDDKRQAACQRIDAFLFIQFG